MAIKTKAMILHLFLHTIYKTDYIGMKRLTLNEVILNLVKDCPDKGIGYIDQNGRIKFVSYYETYQMSLKVLEGLRSRNLQPNDFVLLALDKNEEIIPALWACLLGGMIPSVLQSMVSYSDKKVPEKKIGNIWNLLNQPPVIIPQKANAEDYENKGTDVRLFRFADLANHQAAGNIANPDPSDTAYIQFSSGSTGNPKGILLSHENILTNVHDIAKSNNINPKTVPVNWMPLYHDMGLVGFHLTPLYAQCSQYLIDVVSFIKNPILWLAAISNLGVDVTAGPNFGQALILRHLARKKNAAWDFSTITNFFNGAEPISADIMTRFIHEMGMYGFKETAMIPCYGMAEATLAISMRSEAVKPTIKTFDRIRLYHEYEAVEIETATDGITLVGVGTALGRNKIRIVDDAGIELPEAKTGHIQIKGENVTRKFYNPEFSEHRPFIDGWLITGDRGFFYKAELFITGRTKDLIIVNGQNFYAHDLEQAVIHEKPELYGKIAFCSVLISHAGSIREKLVLFVVGPANQKFADQYQSIRNIFYNKYGLQPEEIIPIKSSDLPRTSSGKLQRYKLTEAYQQGGFEHHPKF
jgi:acyl-CoA synthetase (AMP-forming)/AMP-acid ligase II